MASAESEDIWNEAMALLLQWQRAPDSETSREAIRRFCAQGSEHRHAWDEARRVYRLSGAAVSAHAPRKPSPTKISRRRVVTGLGAVAAGAAIWQGPELWRRWHADAVTGTAEIRQIELPDGSKLTLGPDSKLAMSFTPAARRINLIDGLALCEVAKDPIRPFEASAGALRATANDAIFELGQNAGRSLMGVEAGQIAVALQSGGTRDAESDVKLSSGDWFATDLSGGQIERGKRSPGQTAAWRDKLLVADREQIRSVVAEIGRWRKGEIVIPQTSLAAARVSGLYDLTDPDAALAAVVGPYGGRVVRLSPWLTILTTI
jgi:transmembrane sensor